jgi:hypothetical protein
MGVAAEPGEKRPKKRGEPKPLPSSRADQCGSGEVNRGELPGAILERVISRDVVVVEANYLTRAVDVI